MSLADVHLANRPNLPGVVARALFGAAAFFIVAVGQADAGAFSLSGGTPATLPKDFQPKGWNQAENHNIGPGSEIYVFSNDGQPGGLSLDEPAVLTFTFLGAEASHSSIALVNGTQIFENHKTAYGATSGPHPAEAGFIPFAFRNVTAGDKTAVNGGAIHANVRIGIKLVSPNVAYFFFEDVVGGNPDFDDMVVRVELLGPSAMRTRPRMPGTIRLSAGAVDPFVTTPQWTPPHLPHQAVTIVSNPP